ncbi:iron uptake porin [Gloeocapsa sp. PCC 73106]|uniref:iron uptake porin n=1 Tax=Gloeocapsa sp. PCC 73106 TaxID=102232 RepID=UPI0002AC96DE|nr:iron uptake porin [Gloeocapsa sp. PCC 73106]ELR98592.1 carbohydrate-selective porin [Gloeocapsa sp. PCC 73106]
MSKLFCQVLKTTPILLGVSLLTANSSLAAPETKPVSNEGQTLEQIEQYNNELGEPLSQVTSVSQLRDVSPGDWAFEALGTLVERYGCIVGFPDQTFRGNQPTTRYEFAAGLNACLQQMERLIAASEAVLREDIERLQLLMQEFEAELAALGARVDNLEGRVAFLEDHQFSTTTKLRGEVIMALGNAFGDNKANEGFGEGFRDEATGESVDDNTFFAYRARLEFDTSFNGRDSLLTRLQAANIPNLAEATGTDAADLSFAADSEGDVVIDLLHYQTPIGDNFRLHIIPSGGSFDDIADAKSPFFNDDGTGSISRFASRNPVVYRTGNAAIGLNWQIAEQFSVDMAYLAGSGANRPENNGGIFNGEYLAIGQFNWDPTETIGVAVTYGYGYQRPDEVNLSASTSSAQARNPFEDAGAQAHRFGLQATWRIAERFNIAGWAGGVLAEAQSGQFQDEGSAFIWNAAINFSVLDLLREGSNLGFAFGVPPTTGYRTPDSTTYFLEALYQYPLTENISITPGAYLIINPNENDGNDTIVVGTIRTTFRF